MAAGRNTTILAPIEQTQPPIQAEPARVPHVRASVGGLKKTGEAHPELLLVE
jgi:hypothetical protein